MLGCLSNTRVPVQLQEKDHALLLGPVFSWGACDMQGHDPANLGLIVAYQRYFPVIGPHYQTT